MSAQFTSHAAAAESARLPACAPVIEAARLLRLTLQVLGESLDGQIKENMISLCNAVLERKREGEQRGPFWELGHVVTSSGSNGRD